jgi:serine/threonine protein kinase
MAPEQSLDAHAADTRADIDSLGCTLYYLLIGESPYKGDTIFQVFMGPREGATATLRTKRPDVPKNVDATCQKMLARKPDDRYQSMSELIAAMEDCDIAAPAQRPHETTSTKTRVNKSESLSATTVELPSAGKQRNHHVLRRLLGTAFVLAALFGGFQVPKETAQSETNDASTKQPEPQPNPSQNN